jgi:hypothetical protein
MIVAAAGRFVLGQSSLSVFDLFIIDDDGRPILAKKRKKNQKVEKEKP